MRWEYIVVVLGSDQPRGSESWDQAMDRRVSDFVRLRTTNGGVLVHGRAYDDLLAKLGSEGWELCASTGIELTFKRPIV